MRPDNEGTPMAPIPQAVTQPTVDAREVISRSEAREKGLTKFFRGVPCKHGHISEQYTRSGNCVACAILLSEKQSKDNPEKCKEYREKGKDKKNEYMREYSKKNAEKIKQYKLDNKEKINKQKVEYNREWRKRNREKFLAHARNYVRNRRARRESAEGSHTSNDVLLLLERQKHKCANCLKSVKKSYHVDHIKPLFLGGSNDKFNLQILCPTCNLKKQALDPADWANKNGRLL